jgi:hypothetical protein
MVMNTQAQATAKAPTSAILSLSEDHGGSLSIVADGKQMTIRHENPLFEKAVEAFKQKDWTHLYALITPEVAVRNAVTKYGDVEIADGAVKYKGEEVHNLVVERILHFLGEGFDVLPLIKFLDKLMKNPSRRSRQELYTFLEQNLLTVTENGNFLGYKAVQADWYSITGGTAKLIKGKVNSRGQIYNAVGEEIEVERGYVDDDFRNGCSQGLHVGTLAYATNFGKNLIIVEVDPSYVVSVPSDCNFAKLRTCAYKVVDTCKGQLEDKVYASRYASDNDDTYNPDDEEGDEYDDDRY